MDGCSHVSRAAALAAHTATWLRDEEAAGSNPVTPTRYLLDRDASIGEQREEAVPQFTWRPVSRIQARRRDRSPLPRSGLPLRT
jgi:hypothetical protein